MEGTKKMRIVILIGMIAVAASISGCGKREETTKTQPASEIRDVTVEKVTKSSIEDFYEATGTVKASKTTDVSANMMGRIVAFPVAEGDTVTRGQTLVEIDNRESQTQRQRAEAGLKEAQAALLEIDKSVVAANAGVKTAETNRVLAEKTYGRIKELYDRRSASAQELDEADSRLKSARSEVERAKANVETIISKKKQINARIDQAKAEIAGTRVYESYSRIASPVSGVIVKKHAESGAVASPGMPLLSIEDNSLYRLEAAVEESRSRLVRVGNRVQVRIDSIGDTEIQGTVAEILPSADAASRSYTVKIDLPANPLLKTGLYGLARFPTSQKDAITVPQESIVERGQLSGVFVVGSDGIAQFRIVTVGKTSEGRVEVLSGLSEGDEFVAKDAKRVTDGAKVR